MARSLDQLGTMLRHMYDDAPSGDKVASIHLFGIKYASEIRDGGFTAREVVTASGIRASYLTEVQKGMNLSRFVQPRAQYAD